MDLLINHYYYYYYCFKLTGIIMGLIGGEYYSKEVVSVLFFFCFL